MGEFDLIRRYFASPKANGTTNASVAVGIGDDCAVLNPTPGMQLCISSDMLVEGRHFLSTVDPVRLGHKALAVNLSDLAACGARPLGFTLALSMPAADEAWLAGFSQGLLALAHAHACPLVGGDTTRGPLNICITVFGEVPPGQALLRSGARAGDELWVSGSLGAARLALEAFRGTLSMPQDLFEQARLRMEQPTPRVALGLALRGLASSAIDISDGLLGDLGHVLGASQAGLSIDTVKAAQLLNADCRVIRHHNASAPVDPLDFVLAGGDDYELAFTAAPACHAAVLAAAQSARTPVHCIGRIDSQPGVRLLDAQGQALTRQWTGFDHFA